MRGAGVVVVVLLAALGGAQAWSVSSWVSGWLTEHGEPKDITQCQEYECPEFSVVHRDTEKNYEVRRYVNSKWVSTSMSSTSYRSASYTNFRKLFAYITGTNDKGMSMSMTCPVTTKVQPATDDAESMQMTMSFFVPKEHWTDAPTPTGAGVSLQDLPEMTIVVRAFGGYAGIDDYNRVATELKNDIGDAYRINEDYMYTVGYDSPMKFWSRRNEVWLVVVN